MQIKLGLNFVLLLCLATSICGQDLSSDEIQIRKLKEVDWPEAYQNQDTELLANILADEFQMIDADGNTFKKKDELTYVKDVKPTYDSFEFDVNRLDIFESNTAVMSGLGIIYGKDDKGRYQTTYHSSDVLIKREGVWKAVSSHVSGVQKNYLGGRP